MIQYTLVLLAHIYHYEVFYGLFIQWESKIQQVKVEVQFFKKFRYFNFDLFLKGGSEYSDLY